MDLFQTPSSKKKGIWHIKGSEDDRSVRAICRCFGYWIGGYHKDKPEMTRENMPETAFTGKENLCPACVQQAYIKGLITIQEVVDEESLKEQEREFGNCEYCGVPDCVDKICDCCMDALRHGYDPITGDVK
jgi:hypothetical protein